MMIRDALTAIGTTAREFVRNWRAMAVLNGLYAALLLVLYVFVATKEASVWQIVLTILLALVAPVLFFMIQAAAVRYAQAEEVGPGFLLRQSLTEFWKLLLVSLPLVLLAVLIVYLLNKLQTHFPITNSGISSAPGSYPHSGPVLVTRWQNVLFPSLRLLLLGMVLPLASIHLWIAIARQGFGVTLKRAWHILAHAFSPPSVLVYAIGLILFGLMPYFLIFTRTPISHAWAELILFGIRLGLAFVFTLWGWVITLGALAKSVVVMPEQAGSVGTVAD